MSVIQFLGEIRTLFYSMWISFPTPSAMKTISRIRNMRGRGPVPSSGAGTEQAGEQ
jgi:hypothetical protein